MKIHKRRALRFLVNDYVSTNKDLLDKADRSSMNVNRLRLDSICKEIYETIKNLNPGFMIFVIIDFCIKRKKEAYTRTTQTKFRATWK